MSAIVWGGLVALTAMVVATWYVSDATSQGASIDLPSDRTGIVPASGVAAITVSPPNYRYSVIAGGAHNQRELRDAISRDPVVADHYRTVALDRVRVERTTEARRAYVSYRVGDRVYWTTHKVTVPAGEPILTDGVTVIRARCGNCISFQPQLPTREEEPDEIEFDALMPADSDILSSRSLTPLLPAPVLIATRTAPGVFDLPAPLPTSGPFASQSLPVTAPGLPSPAISSEGRRTASVPSGAAPTQGSNGNAPNGSLPGGSILPGPDSPIPPGPDSSVPPGGPGSGGPDSGGPVSGSPGSGGHDSGGPVSASAGPDSPAPGGPISASDIPQPPPFGGGYTAADGWLLDAPVQPAPIPEPSTVVLVGTGAAAALWRRLRSRRSR